MEADTWMGSMTMERPATPPEFNPVISGEPGSGSEQYWDGTVHAEIGTDLKTYVQIYSFSSHYSGNGYGRRALEWMKENLGPVTVVDPGRPHENPASFGFWKKMAEEGLIHRMEDAENNEIFRDGTWSIPDGEEELYEAGFPEGLPAQTMVAPGA